MSNKHWKQKRLNEIDQEIKNNKILHDHYVDEYQAIIDSNAKSYSEFKNERGVK